MVYCHPHPSICKFLASHDSLFLLNGCRKLCSEVPVLILQSTKVQIANYQLRRLSRSLPSLRVSFQNFPVLQRSQFSLFVPCLRYLPTTFSQHQHTRLEENLQRFKLCPRSLRQVHDPLFSTIFFHCFSVTQHPRETLHYEPTKKFEENQAALLNTDKIQQYVWEERYYHYCCCKRRKNCTPLSKANEK